MLYARGETVNDSDLIEKALRRLLSILNIAEGNFNINADLLAN